MSKRIALVVGANGQDGSYLSEHLVSMNYEVHGIIRRNSVCEHQESRLSHLEEKMITHYGDLNDAGSLEKVMTMVMPDEIYSLGAQSHVRISYDIPQYTAQTNAIGVLNMLEAYRRICPRARFYQASSSECFGDSVDPDGYQRETTVMNPVSPYGCAKVFGYNIVRNYRKAYNLMAFNGLLFNHESPRRGSNFVTNKVVKGAVRISLGLQDDIELGNLDAKRDWGHSYDYVRAMHMIINHSMADDFVVATGETRSVRDMCDYIFSRLDLDYNKYVKVNPKYFRSQELPYLRGDCTKLKNTFGWKPMYTFESMMDEMLTFWVKHYNKK